MALLPIILGVTRGIAPRDAVSLPVQEKAWKQDNYSCRYCGFQAHKYQDIHWIKQGKDRVATTICLFCKQCFTLDQVAPMRSGALVWLPEISQASLHHLCRAIFIARIAPGPMADAARQAMDLLLARREDAKKRLGTDDPAILANVLQDYLDDGDYQQRGKKFAGIRLLPMDRRIIKEGDIEFNQFPQILAYWRSKDGPYAGLMPASWPDMLATLNAA